MHPSIPTRSALPNPRILRPALGLLGLLAATMPARAADDAKEGAPIALFNGQNLDGWYVFTGDKDPAAGQGVFQVTDGAIHVLKDAPAGSRQTFAGLVTKADYHDYRLTLEYKWGTKKFAPRAGPDNVRDAGVCYHVRGPDEIWPVSFECQIQEGDTGDVWAIHTRATSTVHPENLNYVTPAEGGVAVTRGDDPKGYRRFLRSYSYEKEGWNQVELTIRGDSAVYRVNGHVCNQLTALKYFDAATNSWQPLTQGKILLQAEGAEIYYRHVVLTPLEPLAPAAK